MRVSCRPWLLPFVLVGTLPTQETTISPAFAARHEAGSANAIPFGIGPCRYLQLHHDLRGAPRTLREIGFRADAGGAVPDSPARRLEVTLRIGAGEATTPGVAFDAFWRGDPTLAIARREVDVPAATGDPDALPAPFALVLPFDAPLVVPGTHDLAWEIVVHAASSQAPWYADAMTGGAFAGRVLGASEEVGVGSPGGAGCALRSRIATQHGSATWSFALRAAPPFAQAAVVLGGGTLVLPLRADAGGRAELVFAGLPVAPGAEGLGLVAQGIALDGRPGAPAVVVTNAVQTLVPPLVAVAPLTRIWALAPVAASGARGDGEGLVVRFR